MEPSDAARLMWAEQRRFGWQLGAALAAIGLWHVWAGNSGRATALLVVGGTLTLLGLAAPRALVVPHRWWMALGRVMHAVMGPIVLGLIYFVVVTPFGWARRTFGRSQLQRDPTAATYWVPAHDGDPAASERFDKPY